MHSGPVKAIRSGRQLHSGPKGSPAPFLFACRFDQVGRLMASMTTQGPVFLYDARPSSRLSVLGYLGGCGSSPHEHAEI